MKIRAVVNQRRRGVEVEGTIVDMIPVTLSRTRKTLMKATLEDETGSITLNCGGPRALDARKGTGSGW